MNVTGTVYIEAAPTKVWHYLTTPYHLSRCTPGLVSWQVIEPDEKFQLLLAWELSRSNQMQFPVMIEWVELVAPHQLRLTAQIMLGRDPITVPEAMMQLTPTADKQATDLSFTAAIETPNKFMQQLIRGTAPKMIDAFFRELKKKVQVFDTPA